MVRVSRRKVFYLAAVSLCWQQKIAFPRGPLTATGEAARKTPKASILEKGIRQLFKQEPEREWRDHIDAVAKNLQTRKGDKQA